jgi:hypothetical protein
MKAFVVETDGKTNPIVIKEPASQFAKVCASRGGNGICLAAQAAKMRGDIGCAHLSATQTGNGDGICQPFGYIDAILKNRELTKKMRDQLRAAGFTVRG